jgi:hypothetical protein
MSLILFTVLVLLVGAVTYRLLYVWVTSFRVLGACVLMVSLAAFFLQNQIREIIGHQGNSSGASRAPILPDKPTSNDSDPIHDPRSVAYVIFQNFCREDHNFLDEILQKQNPDGPLQGKPASARVRKIGKAGLIGPGNETVLKGELVINTAEAKRSEPVTRKETVKRAQLVIHNETFNRAELGRSSQQ